MAPILIGRDAIAIEDNLHLDPASQNLGIQEWSGIDEEAAAKYPFSDELPQWTLTRLPD